MINLNERFWGRVASIKIIYERQKSYLSIFNTIMLVTLVKFSWWVFVIVLLLLPLWAYLDWKFLFPAERRIRQKEMLIEIKKQVWK